MHLAKRPPRLAAAPHAARHAPIARIVIVLGSSGGLLAVALGMRLAGDGSPGSGSTLFWLGVGMIFVPIAYRLLSPGCSWPEVLSWLLILAAALYWIKILRSPGIFTFHDEFMHWRTAQNIARGEGVFAVNPINPPSARYPGLELATNSLAGATGLSITDAGLLLIGMAKCVLVGTMAIILKTLGASARATALAVLLYVGNPLFLLWSSQFAYESLATPLAVLCLYGTIAAAQNSKQRVHGWSIAIPTGAALVVTHHLTSWGTGLAFLAVAAFIAVASSQWRGDLRARPFLVIGALLTAAAAVWLATVGWNAVRYVGEPIRRGFADIVSVLLGNSASRQLFTSPGTTPPIWERVVAVLSVLIATVFILTAILYLYRRRPVGPFVIAAATAALLYPASVGLRFAEGGQELANRIGSALFIPAAIVVGLAWVAPDTRLRRLAVTAALLLVFAGGVVTGFARYARLPGKHLVSAGPRSIDPAALQATRWTRETYGIGVRVTATNTQALLLGSYGLEHTLSSINTANMSPLFFGTALGSTELELLRIHRVALVIPDVRVTQMLPQDRAFVERGEPDDGQHTSPLPLAYLNKYDNAAGVSRVFDNGAVRVYDVRGAAHE